MSRNVQGPCEVRVPSVSPSSRYAWIAVALGVAMAFVNILAPSHTKVPLLTALLAVEGVAIFLAWRTLNLSGAFDPVPLRMTYRRVLHGGVTDRLNTLLMERPGPWPPKDAVVVEKPTVEMLERTMRFAKRRHPEWVEDGAPWRDSDNPGIRDAERLSALWRELVPIGADAEGLGAMCPDLLIETDDELRGDYSRTSGSARTFTIPEGGHAVVTRQWFSLRVPKEKAAQAVTS